MKSSSNLRDMTIQNYRMLFLDESKTKVIELMNHAKIFQHEPTNHECISKMILYADVLMGDSKFLEDEELQIITTNFLRSFLNAADVSEKMQELEFFIHQFKNEK